MKHAITLAVSTLLLMSCSGTKGNPKDSKPGTEKPEQGASAEIDSKEIQSKGYRLKVDLNFINADVVKFTRFPGSNLQHEVAEYSYTYAEQTRIAPNQRQRTNEYCRVLVEVHPSIDVKEIGFQANGRLITGQISTSRNNNQVDFSLQLQGAAFQSFFVHCHNVTNVEGIRKHVGHLLNIN